MKKKECPSCAMQVESDNKECPVCGYEFPHTQPILKWTAVGLILIFLLYYLI